MQRRSFIAALGMTVMSGCVGSSESNGNTNTTSTSTTKSTTKHDSETTTHDTTFTTRAPPEDRLRIISRLDSEETFRIKLVQHDNDEIVYDKTHTLGNNEVLKLDEYFEPGESYNIYILKDSEQVFEYLIGYYAGVEITIFSENDIEVTSITEA